MKSKCIILGSIVGIILCLSALNILPNTSGESVVLTDNDMQNLRGAVSYGCIDTESDTSMDCSAQGTPCNPQGCNDTTSTWRTQGNRPQKCKYGSGSTMSCKEATGKVTCYTPYSCVSVKKEWLKCKVTTDPPSAVCEFSLSDCAQNNAKAGDPVTNPTFVCSN